MNISRDRHNLEVALSGQSVVCLSIMMGHVHFENADKYCTLLKSSFHIVMGTTIRRQDSREITFREINKHLPKLSNVAMRYSDVIDIGILGCLDNLSNLTLMSCDLSDQAFSNICCLKRLTHLQLRGCHNLVTLNGIENTEKLEFLSVDSCIKLKSIPENIICLNNFKTFHLSDCNSLPCTYIQKQTPVNIFEDCQNLYPRLLKVSAYRLRDNTSKWTRNTHKSFGSDVNKLFAVFLLAIQRLYSFGEMIDPFAKMVNPFDEMVDPFGEMVNPFDEMVSEMIDPFGEIISKMVNPEMVDPEMVEETLESFLHRFRRRVLEIL